MNIFIMLAILLANVIAILLIYQFVRKLPKMEKLIFIVASFAIMYIGVSISYWISGFGIDIQINEALKSFVVYLFVPVNLIILIPFVATKYNKWKQNEIDASELIKRIIIIAIVGVIILTVETIYFKKIKEDIWETGQAAQLDNEAEQQTSTEGENELSENNAIDVTNSISANVTSEETGNVEITNIEETNDINLNVHESNNIE